MAGLGRSLVHAAFGAAAGVAGLAASRCAGGSCSACLACAVPGASMVLLAVLGKVSKLPRSQPVELTNPSPQPQRRPSP